MEHKIFEKTDFLKVKVKNIIDDTPQKINKVLSGHKIRSVIMLTLIQLN